MEKQRRTELEQKLLKQAGEHYHRSLLLHRGITPWRRLVEQSHANAQVNTHTHLSGLTLIHSLTYHTLTHKVCTKPSCCLSHSSAFSPCHTGAFIPVQTFIKMDEQRQDVDAVAGGENREEREKKYIPNPISHKSSKRW